MSRRKRSPAWLSCIELLSTTVIVLLIGGMMIWYEAVVRDLRLTFTIGTALLLYAGGVVGFGRRSDPAIISWWPFALAGLGAGAGAELMNAKFLVTHELLVAAITGVVIGTSQWIALRIWLSLTRGGSEVHSITGSD